MHTAQSFTKTAKLRSNKCCIAAISDVSKGWTTWLRLLATLWSTENLHNKAYSWANVFAVKWDQF